VKIAYVGISIACILGVKIGRQKLVSIIGMRNTM